MKFDNIINNHGKIEREVVDWNLRNLGNKLFGARDWKFIDGYDSETETSISGNSYYVTMGNRALYDNCTDLECNKAAYVLMIKDMCHEKQHV